MIEIIFQRGDVIWNRFYVKLASDLSAHFAPNREFLRCQALMAEENASGPDFICFGGQKGGTRWLFDHLSHHPDFWITRSRSCTTSTRAYACGAPSRYMRGSLANIDRVNRQRGKSNMRPLDRADVEWLEALIWLERQPYDLELYARLFNPKGSQLSGDITPTYSLVSDGQIADLLHRFPKAKILFFARDPIDRFWSQYCMVAGQNDWEDPSDPATVERFISDRNGLRHSALTEIVRRWHRSDTESDFGLFFFDDLRTDATAFTAPRSRLSRRRPRQAERQADTRVQQEIELRKVVMRPEVRERLIGLLGDEVRACAKEFGGPASEWPKQYGL